MTALDAAVQPLWLPRRRLVSAYKYTCPKCGREHGKRSLLELWQAKLRLAMGANGEADIDSGDGNDTGKFLIDDNGKLKICGVCCCPCLALSDLVTIVLSGVDAAICVGCQDGGSFSRDFQTSNVDGTYVLTREFLSRSSNNTITKIDTQSVYSYPTNDCSPPETFDEFDNLIIQMTFVEFDGKCQVFSGSVRAGIPNLGTNAFFISLVGVPDVSRELCNDPLVLNNDGVCGIDFHSDGGTMTVTRNV